MIKTEEGEGEDAQRMGCCQSDGASLPTEELTPEEREKRRQERLAAAEHRAKDFKQGGGIKRKKRKEAGDSRGS